MLPLVTVIIASYNKADMIRETIMSVRNQTHSNWELIVVDDCSTDHSLEILKEFENDKRLRVITLRENKGANYCRNLGIENAKGGYVVFIDSDDLFAPSCLEKRLNVALQYPDTDLLIFSMGVFQKQPGDAAFVWTPSSKRPLRDFLQHLLPWTIVQPLWKKDILKKLGGFDLNFQRLQDVELHTRALMNSELSLRLIGGIPDCYYRIDEQRKNFDSFTFLNRWITAARMYCVKFSELVDTKDRKFLGGTLYQAYLQVLYRYKKNEISLDQVQVLENKLLDGSSASLRFVFRLAKMYNLKLFRVPGINRLFHKTAILCY